MSCYMITEAQGSLNKNEPTQEKEVLIEFSKNLSIRSLPDHIISLIEEELRTTAPWMVNHCKTWMWHQTLCRIDPNDADDSDQVEVEEPPWELEIDDYDLWDEWVDDNGYGSDGFAMQSKCDIRHRRIDDDY